MYNDDFREFRQRRTTVSQFSLKWLTIMFFFSFIFLPSRFWKEEESWLISSPLISLWSFCLLFLELRESWTPYHERRQKLPCCLVLPNPESSFFHRKEREFTRWGLSLSTIIHLLPSLPFCLSTLTWKDEILCHFTLGTWDKKKTSWENWEKIDRKRHEKW